MKTLLLCLSAALFSLALNAAKPPRTDVTLRDFKLTGEFHDAHADFTLTAIAHADSADGSLELLSGAVALTEIGPHPKWLIRAEENHLTLSFVRAGEFPIQLKFSAAVSQAEGWNSVAFHVAAAGLQPIVLRGLAADTQFKFPGAARPDRVGGDFNSFLPANGAVNLSWQEARPETGGKLFFAAEAHTQITVHPGLVRQVALLDFKVMQGEIAQVALRLNGEGEVTRVQGAEVLSWNIEPGEGGARRLLVRLNQAQKDHFRLVVQMQSPLGAFPQVIAPLQFRPEAATRFAGWIRVVNDGAVRLEVTQASGLSQISPEQFPEEESTKALWSAAGAQRFAYRFSGPDFSLRIQADQILPELSVSQTLAYHLGEGEQAIDAEIELDIREAPLRELLLRVPKGYAVARLTVADLGDYFLSEPPGQTTADLRLVFTQPELGHQLIQLRLERNHALATASWVLPRVEVAGAKSVRGHVAVAADAGFRLTAERTQALTEIATAFFPGKVANLQAAFRLGDPLWAATLRVEHLPQTVSADVFHLFSIGEGIAYGSSVINYAISGAPISTFRVELSPEYFNVEFTGKDIRNWQKTNGGYLIQLHTPVSGACTLLATYERPFKPQGETLTFTGARPLDAQTEQGHSLIISAYQFQVKAVDVSPGLVPLEAGEVPAEYHLFFDAPILAAYHYTSRPFNLQLALSPLAQGDSLSQVVDRATLDTHISKEGQVLTEARYFVKNRGNPNFRVTLPPGTHFWSATVNGAAVVPVTDAGANLIPLPPRADPNALLTVELKLAAVSTNAAAVSLTAPSVAAPVLLAEWKLEPDAGRRLVFRRGSLTPVNGPPDSSGFASLVHLFTGSRSISAIQCLLLALGLAGVSVLAWHWAARAGRQNHASRHAVGTVLGLFAFGLAIAALFNLGNLAAAENRAPASTVTLLAPVQTSGSSLTVEVANLPAASSLFLRAAAAWPALAAITLWLCGWLSRRSGFKSSALILGWTCLAWAALRLPDGVRDFSWVLAAFLLWQVALPALRRLWQLSRQAGPSPLAGQGSPAAALFLLAGFLCLGFGGGKLSAREIVVNDLPPQAETVIQQIRVEDKFVFATAKIHWHALRGQALELLDLPAVLTHLTLPPHGLKLIDFGAGDHRAQALLALENGAFDAEAQYQMQVGARKGATGFSLPTQSGLVNRIKIALTNLDVDVFSPQAVSVQRESSGGNTVASLVLSPSDHAWIGWKPRSRDVTREKPVFYAELYQLYVPAAGVIEGAHYAAIRPAQGELRELVFDVPAGATITDVLDPANPASIVSLWRFDPDTRKLRVSLAPAQSRPFALLIRSQIATGPLPLAQSVGLLATVNAAEQIDLLGIATGNEVQLDQVTADGCSPINLEDFPAIVGQELSGQFPGFAVHRAFRCADAKAVAVIKASAVEPDVRVDTQTTLSLGEDRTVLAATADVDITRAGIFRLSFVLPPGMDVETVSGGALSHWTELNTVAGRVITLHLRGKTLGRQQFVVSLAGPGVKSASHWAVPQLVLREAGKQHGTLVIVPEQGLRLQTDAREGLTQLDPQQSGIHQKGVLAFRILQTPCSLALMVEQVEPWVQVTSLQHATVSEAQVKVLANLQYQIENTGLKGFRILLPTNAADVRFTGDQVADFLPVAGTAPDRWQEWDVKLRRRVIGQYLLQTTYQVPLPERASDTTLRGVKAVNVNLQRGFLAVQAGGRVQVRIDAPPAALQAAEWQGIPRFLQQDLADASANYAYRLVDPAFELPLKLDRREAAKLLPARIESATFTSVISDSGVMLTQARLEMLPGDKRLLNFRLPPGARFWFAFVNGAGVWPWTNQDGLLLPLEQQSRGGQPLPVEVFYTSPVGTPNQRAFDTELSAPKLDLPLENVTWRVFLNDQWRLESSTGSFQLATQQAMPGHPAVDAGTYLQTEAVAQRDQAKAAEEMLAAGNSLLQNGDPQHARRAFQAAFSLSQGDDAFNEDSRVQLNNLKLQQALVGLNLRQAAIANDSPSLNAKFRDLHGRQQVAYSQQDAKDMIDRNSADENAALMRLAERLIQQQDAAISNPAAIRANLPEQGRELVFKRAVVIDPWADLKLHLKTVAAPAASRSLRLLTLAGVLLICAAFARATRSFRERGIPA